MVKGECFYPQKHKKSLIYKDFCVRVQNCCTIMAPRTGLEPVTRQIQTPKFVRTYRGRHGSRIEFLRAKIFCFKNSCFVPLTEKNSHSGYFPSRQLPTSQRSVGMQMIF